MEKLYRKKWLDRNRFGVKRPASKRRHSKDCGKIPWGKTLTKKSRRTKTGRRRPRGKEQEKKLWGENSGRNDRCENIGEKSTGHRYNRLIPLKQAIVWWISLKDWNLKTWEVNTNWKSYINMSHSICLARHMKSHESSKLFSKDIFLPFVIFFFQTTLRINHKVLSTLRTSVHIKTKLH